MDRTPFHIIVCVESFIYIPLYISFVLLIVKSPQLRQIKTNQLMLNLSLAYLIVGVFSFFIDISGEVVMIIGSGYMYSNISTLMLCIDRLVCICWPYQYSTLHKGFHFLLMSCSPIIFMFFLLYNAVKSNQSGRTMMKSAIITFNICMMIIINSIVYLVFRKQRRKISNQEQGTSISDHENRILLFKKEVRALYLCFGCCITSIVCYLPIVIVRIHYIGTTPEETSMGIAITLAISNLNPIADAFFFLRFSKEIRSSFTKLKKNKLTCHTIT